MAVQIPINEPTIANMTSDNLRILMLIPNLDCGGAQRAFSNLSVELAQKHRVYVATFNAQSGVAFAHGGQLIDLEVPGGRSTLQKIVFFLRRITRVRAVKRMYNIDISISFLEGADY